MIWPFWEIFWNSSSQRGVGLFLIEWYLSIWTILSSVPPGHILSPIHLGHWLEQKHNRLLNCPLAFQVYSLSTHFMELPCLTQKMETKSLREPHAASPELRSMVGLPVPTLGVGSCSAPKTAAPELCAPPPRAWHGGLLSHSKQRSDAIVPGLSPLQKGEGIFHMSFSSLALTCQRHIIRLCLVLKYKLGRNHKDKISPNPQLCRGFVFLLVREV